MRLPYVNSGGAKDIRENPGKPSPFTKAGRALFALGFSLLIIFDRSVVALAVVGGMAMALGGGFMYLGRNEIEDPADRLK
jgi:hypothetical protein